MRMAGRPETVSRTIVPRETPPITWSVKICQGVPIVAIGAPRLRSSIMEVSGFMTELRAAACSQPDGGSQQYNSSIKVRGEMPEQGGSRIRGA
jgi:hypothetical protein